jgi:hypothetical protein
VFLLSSFAWSRCGGQSLTTLRFALHPGAVVTPQTQNHAGPIWSQVLSDDEGLAGAFCVWLSSKSRQWLSGRYLSCNWDVDELEGMEGEIVARDLLKFKMGV